MTTKPVNRRKKSFDCVEMMHRAAQAVKAVTDPMTFEERVAYWRRQSDAFRKELAERRKAKPKTAARRG